MTNHWIDIKNSDCIVIMGGNAAENHPMSFRWVMKAMEERGAKLIVADPRFTRSAAKADIYAPLRPGTDIPFINGMISYVIENKKYHEEYVRAYTNAALLVKPEYNFDPITGLFSGYDVAGRKYDPASWGYQTELAKEKEKVKQPDGTEVEVEYDVTRPLTDPTMTNPQCVLQILKKHVSRYTPEVVEKICGTPKEKFIEFCEAFAETADPKKTGTILYAMGWTQHTVGTQNVRAFAILQALLGNVGRPGGGVNALRGEPNVQGSTDMALLFHLLPGYLPVPTAAKYPNFQAYKDEFLVARKTKNILPGSVVWWRNGPKYIVSLLKAWWGEAAQPENDFCYDWLPKIGKGYQGGGYSHIALFEAMYGGVIKGFICVGQNPVVGGPNTNIEKAALDKLEWLVDLNLWETETNSFWKRPGCKPEEIQTEVFRLPAADSVEKDGSTTDSGRLICWREKGAEPLGDCKSDLEILDLICKELKELYKKEGGPNADAILKLVWDYGEPASQEAVLKELHGYTVADKKFIDKNFVALKADGSTACGNWLYCGTFAPDGTNLTRRRTPEAEGIGNNLEWAFAWPLNRRIVYNRASCDLEGKPWNPDIPEIWWDPNKVDPATGKPGMWTGNDIPDFPATRPPTAVGGALPAIMTSEGVFKLFCPSGLNEGPLPEHYEPLESPVVNLMSKQQVNPCIKLWHEVNPDNKVGTPEEYPIVASTYRVTEHWQTGIMTRNQPWLIDLMPEMFVEMGKELAAEKGIKPGETVEVVSARGSLQAVAIVTGRVKPFVIDGKTVHFVGLPFHYGYAGLCTGGAPGKDYAANQLTPHIGDPNTMIPEYKAFLCDVRKVK